MPVLTSTVTINAAFLEEIKEDDRELERLLAEARRTLCERSGQGVSLVDLAELFAELRQRLAVHFSLEEAFGYFEDPISAAPHLCERAQTLRGQHGDLHVEMCAIASLAEESPASTTATNVLEHIRAKFADFDGRLQAHEGSEMRLLQQAYQEDIGVGD